MSGGWQAAAAAEGKTDCGSPDKELIIKITIGTRWLCVKNRIATVNNDPNQGVFCK